LTNTSAPPHGMPGANMVTHSARDLQAVLTRLAGIKGGGAASCDWCALGALSLGF